MNRPATTPPGRGIGPTIGYAAGFIALAVGSFFVTRALTDDSSGGSAANGSTTTVPASAPSSSAAGGTSPDGSAVSVAVADTSGATTSAPTEPSAPPTTVDPLGQLEATKAADHDAVEALVGSWVPQLSAKRLGTEDDGIVYTFADIVANHQTLVDQFGVRLLFSGDYNFKATDLWVSVVPVTSPTPDGALAFCTDHGIDRDNCFAKFITHDMTITDTVELQP